MIVDIRDATAATCGAKGGSLGRLARAGARVPEGFVLPFDVYRAAVAGLEISGADGPGARRTRRLIEARPVPAHLTGEMAERLAALGHRPAAVRSSASTEDTATASAAGQHDSFLGIRGVRAVTAKVRVCWGSLWSVRAVAYREAHGLSSDPAMAVVIQQHIDADVAGVLVAPAAGTGEPSFLEASWGLGDSVVSGRVTPDAWTVLPTGRSRHTTGDKRTRLDRGPAGAVTRAVPVGDQRRPCLGDADVRRLVAAGRDVARLFGAAVDIEWALADGQIWLLQARPVTAPVPLTEIPPAGAAKPADGRTTLAGLPGSPGAATGPARVITGPRDFGRAAAGDILVCRCTDPAWTPLLTVAAGVVTETGGILSHAAIVARERAIPAVLGVPGAMTALRDGEPVTIDGGAGTVRQGPGCAR